MLVVFHHHELPESVAHTQARHVVLERRGIEFASDGTDSEKEEASETHDVEVARLVSLVLVIQVLQVILGDAAAVVEPL